MMFLKIIDYKCYSCTNYKYLGTKGDSDSYKQTFKNNFY